MRAFPLTCPEHPPMVIFARDVINAIEVFVTWRDHLDLGITEFTVDRTWAERLKGRERENMLEALKSARPGIGCRYSDELGWAVRGPRSPIADWTRMCRPKG